MLGQVLGRGLLCQAGAVQEFPLQQGKVCLFGEEEVGRIGLTDDEAQGHSLALILGREADSQPYCETLGKLHDLSQYQVPPLQPGYEGRKEAQAGVSPRWSTQ